MGPAKTSEALSDDLEGAEPPVEPANTTLMSPSNTKDLRRYALRPVESCAPRRTNAPNADEQISDPEVQHSDRVFIETHRALAGWQAI
jgi:hypothetical protein